MTQSDKIHFEEKILYKTHQHWIILVTRVMQYTAPITVLLSSLTYFFSSYSLVWTSTVSVMVFGLVTYYVYYLWNHSWLLIGNQKITLSVRNGLFSQFAMNVRYRNVRDAAVSKHSIFGYMFKYGTLFVRSSANEGDFQAHYIPKVGKVYALVNALTRYTDQEREHIDSIEKLHHHHQSREFSHLRDADVSRIIEKLSVIPGVVHIIEGNSTIRSYIQEHEELRNHGVHEALRRKHILILLHNHEFRDPPTPLVSKNSRGEVFFPGVDFPEIKQKDVISGSPSALVHQYLIQFFPYADSDDATIIIGWN